MNKFNYTFLKEKLLEFEESNICNLCSKTFANPVRIKICGHYFCEVCLKNKSEHECPTCNKRYELSELDHVNIRKFQIHLDKLKTVINSVEKVENDNKPGNGENSFVLNGKVYHVNYSEELYKKVNVKGESPLHVACRKKKIKDVKNLLKRDIDINIQDFAGWAPIVSILENYIVCLNLIYLA